MALKTAIVGIGWWGRHIIDSTNFMLDPSLKDIFKGNSGTASKSSMRIQFMYDYFSGKVYIQIGDTRTDDAKALSNIVLISEEGGKSDGLFTNKVDKSSWTTS